MTFFTYDILLLPSSHFAKIFHAKYSEVNDVYLISHDVALVKFVFLLLRLVLPHGFSLSGEFDIYVFILTCFIQS